MRTLFVILLAALIAVPATAMAAPSVEELQRQIQALQQQLNQLSEQVQKAEEVSEEVEELSARVDKTERHTALDRINWYGDLRGKADSLVYKGLTLNQGMLVDFDDFGGKAMAGAFGNPMDPSTNIAKLMAKFPSLMGASGKGMFGNGVQKWDADNSILYTTRLRLGMKAKVWDNVSFSGRLNMYKGWGDSTGVKVFDSFDSFTMDGTNSGNTTGDTVHVERAYFDWKDIGGSDFYLSIGRRPSSYGPPTHFRENEMRGGTPSGHLVNFNFDGITVGYKLGKLTGIEGQTVRFCYGQGFESEFGNGSLFAETDLDDTHLAGFNIDAINDGTTLVQLTAFRAFDLTDSFKGLAVMPFADTTGDGIPNGMNDNAYISRFQGRENLGDMNLVGLGFTREEMNGVNWFTSLGWTRTEPNKNFNPMGLGGLLYDALPVMEVTAINDDLSVELEHSGEYIKSNNWDKDRDGYSIYAGVQIPAPLGKVGFEYNYGSKYWTPFTQAQDDIVGSKLATRGHVGEAYYIFDINPKMFLKLGGIYYDYEYTGSGSPVGKPKKISDVQKGTEFSMFPAIDEAWDINASVTVKF